MVLYSKQLIIKSVMTLNVRTLNTRLVMAKLSIKLSILFVYLYQSIAILRNKIIIKISNEKGYHVKAWPSNLNL